MEGTIQCPANYIPLSPISFLKRSAIVYGDRVSIIYGDHVKFTWKETHERCVRLASALTNHLGIARGDIVAVLAPNVPEMYELHFGVPMAGAILSTLNTHYDSSMVSILLEKSNAKVLFVEYQFFDIAKEAIDIILSKSNTHAPRLVLIPESDTPPSLGASKNEIAPSSEEILDTYDALLAKGDHESYEIQWPNDECDPITLSYTSGTTSTTPKGVVYSHRGAYLNSLGTILLNEMPMLPIYLWTVPMFHCNGWCLPWGVAAQGGTNICLRAVSNKTIFENISKHRVTHMGGAPTILNMIANASATERDYLVLPEAGKVTFMTGGAAPPPQVLFKMEELGFNVIHCYGQTETYGAGTVCTWKPEWSCLPLDAQAKIKARQGVNHLILEQVDVKDPVTMKSTPWDGKTMGSVMYRGNTVMSGYFKDLEATQEAFKDGWFRSGDIGVIHHDGYIEIKDRSQDIIISRGEYVSTIEVEAVLYSHPEVLEAAVVGKPDDDWKETACAFVKLKDGCGSSAEDIAAYCRDCLPDYRAPLTVVFDDFPKTSTGKTQKFILREKAKLLNGA